MTDDKPNPWAEIVGPCYTVASMARTLAWTEREVLKAGLDLRLLMLHTEDGVDLFPARQLHDGKVVEGLTEVLRVLQTGVNDSWTWAQFLNVPLDHVDPPRVIGLLRSGRLDDALQQARHDAWTWGSWHDLTMTPVSHHGATGTDNPAAISTVARFESHTSRRLDRWLSFGVPPRMVVQRSGGPEGSDGRGWGHAVVS